MLIGLVISYSIVLMLVIYFISKQIQQRFGLQKRKWFGFNYINQKHNFIDVVARIFIGIALMFMLILSLEGPPYTTALLMAVVYPIVLASVECIRAWFEWYRSDQPQQAYITCINIAGGYIFALLNYVTLLILA
ncbi:DUF4181 domain-containing protein [Amphibacillus cookii]|uniref:DUF4181 domain-containing protein n=1 Tax=Amphibacillus cookii TaxID=767787 RepID=UPI00195B4786|nr:DUF4181 domain-containing protein [Amphibacillus cookii]MBM7540880.1 hypothetical protein [Amphibacillus cookii]